MPADDAIKPAVVAALRKDGWTITDDPLALDYEEVTVAIDLGGERLVAAERGPERIAVEIKTFGGNSRVRDFRDALGQYDVYRMILEDLEPDRKLYIATSDIAFHRLFGMRAIRRLTAKKPMPLIIVDIATEEVLQWIG